MPQGPFKKIKHKLLRKKILLPLILIVISILIYFSFLGDIRVFRSDDEFLYMHIAREMFGGGEYWIPIRFGAPAFFKPPFLYWIMMLFFKLFGVSVFTARIPVALTTIATVYLVYLIGKDFYGETYGFAAAVIFATSFGVIAYGRLGLMDIPLTFLIVASAYFFHLAVHKNKQTAIMGFFVLTGLSTLVKGPISGIILILFVVLYCLLFKKWDVFKTRWSVYGMILGIFSALSWPFMVYIKGRWHEWFSFFIMRENLGKFSDINYSVWRFLLYYIEFLFPWSLFFITALGIIIYFKLYKKQEYAFPLLLAASCIIVFVFPATKLKHFLVPAIPAAALLISGVIKDFRENTAVKTAFYCTIPIFVILFIVLLGISRFSLGAGHIIFFVATGCVFLFVGVWYLIKNKICQTAVFFSGFVISLIVLWAWLNMPIIPALAVSYFKEGRIYAVRRQTYVYSYFTGRPVIQVESPEEFLSEPPKNSKIIISENDLMIFQKNNVFKNFKMSKIYTWQYWKANIPISEVFSALKNKDLNKLKESVYILNKEK